MSRRFRREIAIAVAWLVLLTVLGLLAPKFFRDKQLKDMLVNMAPVIVAATGMTLVMLARQIDISVGSSFSVCGVLAGLAADAGWPMPFVAATALACGGALGAVNGLLVAGLRFPAIVVTLSTLVGVREVLRFFREGEFVRNLPHFQWFGLSQDAGQWVVIVIAAIVFVTATWALANLAGGRAIYATGSDAEAARLMGIRPRSVVFGAFVACGALTGLASLLGAVRFADVDPNAGAGLEMQVIAAVVVGGTSVNGGRGTLLGTLLGVLLLSTIGPALGHLGVEAQWARAIQGIVILAAVASDGLFGGRR